MPLFSRSFTLQQSVVLTFFGLYIYSAGNLNCAFAVFENERNALLDLYWSTNGLDWTYQQGWTEGSSDYCTWHGVKCSNGHVVKLDFRNNNLVGHIPQSFGNLSQLESLDLRNNNIKSLPSSMESLKESLTFIRLDHNPTLNGLPPVMYDLVKLTSLHVEGCNIPRIQPEIQNLQALINVNLQDNKLLTLPTEICKIPIHTLHITGNLLREFSECTSGQLTGSLQQMFLDDNSLTGLPDSIGLYAKLSILIAKNNHNLSHVPALPPTIQILDLSHCGISTLPSLGGVLEVLYLQDNRLTILPDLSGLSSLTHMDISDNQITDTLLEFMQNTLKTLGKLSTLVARNAFVHGGYFQSCGLMSDPTECNKVILFPQLSVLNLADNPTLTGDLLNGTRRDIAGLGQWSILPALSVLDVSNTNFGGGIWGGFSRISLLNVTNIPDLTSRIRSFPSFLRHDDTTWQIYPENFTCPSVMGLQEPMTVIGLDPAYYGYTECKCRTGFLGKPPQCSPCTSRHTYCRDGQLYVSSGWWTSDASIASPTVTQCPIVPSIPPEEVSCNPLDVNTREPSPGYHCRRNTCGRLCAACEPGWYRKGHQCQQCMSFDGLLVGIIVLLLIILIIPLVACYRRRKDSFVFFRRASGMISILLFYQQALNILNSHVLPRQRGFETWLRDFLSSASFVGEAGVSLQCYVSGRQTPIVPIPTSNYVPDASCVPSFEERSAAELSVIVATAWAVPFLCILVCVALYTLKMLSSKYEKCDRCFLRIGLTAEHMDGLRSRVFYLTVLFIINVVYFPASEAILSALPCEKVTEGIFLQNSPAFRCSSPVYTNPMAIVAWIGMILVIGTPIVLFLGLIRESGGQVLAVFTWGAVLRKWWHSCQRNKAVEKTLESRQLPDSLTRMFSSFRQGCSWFELIILFRRVALVLVTTMIPFNSPMLPLCVFFVIQTAIIIQHFVHPYGRGGASGESIMLKKNTPLESPLLPEYQSTTSTSRQDEGKMENRCEILSLYTVLLSYFAGSLLSLFEQLCGACARDAATGILALDGVVWAILAACVLRRMASRT